MQVSSDKRTLFHLFGNKFVFYFFLEVMALNACSSTMLCSMECKSVKVVLLTDTPVSAVTLSLLLNRPTPQVFEAVSYSFHFVTMGLMVLCGGDQNLAFFG